ncbi:MAG TPA: hypothetical protein VIV60_04435 [Polyangiaceae bacterium]
MSTQSDTEPDRLRAEIARLEAELEKYQRLLDLNNLACDVLVAARIAEEQNTADLRAQLAEAKTSALRARSESADRAAAAAKAVEGCLTEQLDKVKATLKRRTTLLLRWKGAHQHEPRTRLFAETEREFVAAQPAPAAPESAELAEVLAADDADLREAIDLIARFASRNEVKIAMGNLVKESIALRAENARLEVENERLREAMDSEYNNVFGPPERADKEGK